MHACILTYIHAYISMNNTRITHMCICIIHSHFNKCTSFSLGRRQAHQHGGASSGHSCRAW